MKKILIIGNDLHSERYKSVLFFSDNYIVSLDYSNKNINRYDYIIFSEPLNFNINVFKLLENYKGILLIEKLQTNINLIEKLKCKIYFIHLRLFDNKNKKLLKNNNYIIWPNLVNDKMSKIYNTLPNIFDYVKNEFSLGNNYEIVNMSINTNTLLLEVDIDKVNFIIEIYDTENVDEKPKFNNDEINWPNYFNCINSLFDKLSNNKLNFKESIQIEKKYNKLIKEMEKNMELFKLKYKYNEKVIYKDRGDMLMAYNQETSDMYEFNAVGADIFKLLAKNVEIDELFNWLNGQYGTKTNEIYEDVKEIIDRLIELNVITIIK